MIRCLNSSDGWKALIKLWPCLLHLWNMLAVDKLVRTAVMEMSTEELWSRKIGEIKIAATAHFLAASANLLLLSFLFNQHPRLSRILSQTSGVRARLRSCGADIKAAFFSDPWLAEVLWWDLLSLVTMWGRDFSAGGRMNSPGLMKMLPEWSLPKHSKCSTASLHEIRQILSKSRLRRQVKRY